MTRNMIFLTFSMASLWAGTLSREDRDFAEKRLLETRETFLNSITELSEAQWSFRTAPDQPSIAELARSAVAGQSMIFRVVVLDAKGPSSKRKGPKLSDQEVVRASESLTFRKDKESNVTYVVQQQGTDQASPYIKSSNEPPQTPAHVRQEFESQFSGIIDYIKNAQDDLRGHLGFFPDYDAYQELLMIPGLTKAVAAQINQIKAHAGYPNR